MSSTYKSKYVRLQERYRSLAKERSELVTYLEKAMKDVKSLKTENQQLLDLIILLTPKGAEDSSDENVKASASDDSHSSGASRDSNTSDDDIPDSDAERYHSLQKTPSHRGRKRKENEAVLPAHASPKKRRKQLSQ
ncbi:uncharacterized protein SPPG_04787 [Spizellomyces punctatus DAOM BR117]|uniref:Uncharacterized protein n=1 Tax=Spizellomyces punctatus (strain DAOM BR117) TaxID=645134 RepID=A0A0L0HG51_SPIPD|nr:uncharacterized protein SPPG_04787 [Spizellomyces punctatus DAOM BR117]KND00471.1 hypothetical protein SPPG_04787 [Spizellomyces punctatus DAOM BR117]|eukprot:XP_016608510.1 hypothetical protein SPPG_04787 [Spizellomyces punctatus DAOM BR117]